MTRTRGSNTWALADAKSRLGEVVDRAIHEGPQRVTKHGKDAVVIVSADAWKRLSGRRRPLVEFLRGGLADVPRDPDTGRDVDL